MKCNPMKAVMVAGVCLLVSACAAGSAKAPDPAPPKPVPHAFSSRKEQSHPIPVVTILGRDGDVAREINAPGPAIVAQKVVGADTDTSVGRSKHRPQSFVETSPTAPIDHKPPSVSKGKGKTLAPTPNGRTIAKPRPAPVDHENPPVSRKARTAEPSLALSVTKAAVVPVVVESSSGVKVWRVPAGAWRLMRWRAGGIELVPSHAKPRMGVGIKPVTPSSLLVTTAGKEMRLKPGETAVISAVRHDGSVEELAIGLGKETK